MVSVVVANKVSLRIPRVSLDRNVMPLMIKEPLYLNTRARLIEPLRNLISSIYIRVLESDRDNKRAVRFSRKLNYICFHCRSVNTTIIDQEFS